MKIHKNSLVEAVGLSIAKHFPRDEWELWGFEVFVDEVDHALRAYGTYEPKRAAAVARRLWAAAGLTRPEVSNAA